MGVSTAGGRKPAEDSIAAPWSDRKIILLASVVPLPNWFYAFLPVCVRVDM